MDGNFYDAVVLGTDLSAVSAAALLAKRGFRVLLLGQGAPLPSYRATRELTLPTAPFTLLAAQSPVLSRVFSELAIRPAIRRKIAESAGPVQLVMQGHRLDLHASVEALGAEVDREFPAIRRASDELIRSIERRSAALDTLLERDLVWPPGTFLERRQLARASLHQPFGKPGLAQQPLADLPTNHPFRQLLSAAMVVLDGSELGDGSPARQQRLIGAWLGAAQLDDDSFNPVFDLLLESVRSHNGDVRLEQRAERLLVKHGSIEGVQLATSGERIGANFVLWGLPIAQLARLCADRDEIESFVAEHGNPRPRLYRYTLNLVLRTEGLPPGLGTDAIVLGRQPRSGTALPVLRLKLYGNAHAPTRVLCVETLLAPRAVEADELAPMRERIRQELSAHFPFLDRHLSWIDSPHDGRGVQDIEHGAELPPETPWLRGPRTMEVVYAYARTSSQGCCSLPVRTPIRRLLLASAQVVPGLPLEGQFLAGWSAARVVGRTLKRDWMNRGRWTKIDL